MKHRSSSINCASTFPACLFINFFLFIFFPLCCSREHTFQGRISGESLELQAQDVPGGSPGCGTSGAAAAAKWMSLVVCSEEGKPDLCLPVWWRGDFGVAGHGKPCCRCAFIPPSSDMCITSWDILEDAAGTVPDLQQHQCLHVPCEQSPFPHWTLKRSPLSFSSGGLGRRGVDPHLPVAKAALSRPRSQGCGG